MRLFAQDLTTDTLQHIAARGLSEAGGPKPLLLRVLVDLFVRRAAHSEDEIQHFAEIAYTVLPGATAAEIDHAAMRLARHPSAPGELLDLLATRAREGALALLTHSRRLATRVLHDAAAQGSPQIALALAARDDLDPLTISLLIARPEPALHLRLVQNHAAPVSDHLGILVERAKDNAALACALCERLPQRAECWALFLHATRPTRLIMIGAAQRHLGFQKAHASHVLEPASQTALRRLHAAAQEPHNTHAAVSGTLADVLSCARETARDITQDAGGEPLVLVLRALGADALLVKDIAQFLQPDATQGQLIWRQSLAASVPARVAQELVAGFTGVRLITHHQPLQENLQKTLQDQAIAVAQPAAQPRPDDTSAQALTA